MIQYLSFSVWLISLRIMSSKSIHVAANSEISFFLWRNSLLLYTYRYTYIPYLLYPFICWWNQSASVPRQIVNNAAMNTGVYVSFQISVFDFSVISWCEFCLSLPSWVILDQSLKTSLCLCYFLICQMRMIIVFKNIYFLIFLATPCGL